MKGAAKAILVVMMNLTGIYISIVVCTNSSIFSLDISSTSHDVVYNAGLYTSLTPPSIWYTRDQLGIVGVMEYGPDDSLQLQIVVNLEKEPFPLQREQPIFLYKDRFFRVTPFRVTPNLESTKEWHTRRWQILMGVALGVGWISVGVLLIKWRKKK
jgi:hypothetical protein